MVEVKTMPEYVVVEWNKTLKLNTGKHIAQRELINQAFDRSNGQLVLNLKKSCFKTSKETVLVTCDIQFTYTCVTYELTCAYGLHL